MLRATGHARMVTGQATSGKGSIEDAARDGPCAHGKKNNINCNQEQQIGLELIRMRARDLRSQSWRRSAH